MVWCGEEMDGQELDGVGIGRHTARGRRLRTLWVAG